MGFIEKALKAANKAGHAGIRKLKENHEKQKAKAKARTKALLEKARKGKPAVTPVKPVSTQPATSAKPVAVKPS